MNRELTKYDVEAAKKLKSAYNREKKIRGLSQERAAEELGWSQSGLAHYLNARRKFNLSALAKICNFLGEDPEDIHPELVKKAKQEGILMNTNDSESKDIDTKELQQLFENLTEEQQDIILKEVQEFMELNRFRNT
jgi:transcriptional regulator with XRE-family HTH domain